MAHPPPPRTPGPEREPEAEQISIIDPDQEEDIRRRRQQLMLKRKSLPIPAAPIIPYTANVRKRSRGGGLSLLDEINPPAQRLRTGIDSRQDVFLRTTQREEKSPIDMLTDNLLIEIFKHLPQLPNLLSVRQVCRRWYTLSCKPLLWTTLSFEGHEHVNSHNLEALCKNTPALRNLKRLSLARVHGVSDIAVRLVPRTECAATLESVDLTWCSGASDKSVVEFSRCPGLKELRLSHCRQVTRRSVRILAVRCPRLEILDLNCISGVRDSLLNVIGQNCPFLRLLNIANGRHVTDEGIANIANGCPRLEVLDLSWCGRVTDWAILKIATNMPNLRDVGLSETRVTDFGITELTQWCSKLEALHLARCINISNFGVESIILHCSKRLTSLNLASCQNVSDAFVERLISECESLTCLDVSKLPCRTISDMLDRLTASRSIQVYF